MSKKYLISSPAALEESQERRIKKTISFIIDNKKIIEISIVDYPDNAAPGGRDAPIGRLILSLELENSHCQSIV